MGRRGERFQDQSMPRSHKTTAIHSVHTLLRSIQPSTLRLQLGIRVGGNLAQAHIFQVTPVNSCNGLPKKPTINIVLVLLLLFIIIIIIIITAIWRGLLLGGDWHRKGCIHCRCSSAEVSQYNITKKLHKMQ